MFDGEQILISLEPRHASNILSGEKGVELRRRSMKVQPGDKVWLYSKIPVGSVVGSVIVDEVYSGSPSTIWRKYGGKSGITKAEFNSYFSGVAQGFVLIVGKTKKLNNAITLGALREISDDFHPPQFFVRLWSESPVLAAVTAAS